MPAAPKRPCRKPGCTKLHTNASGFCDVHDAAERKRVDERRGTASERGYDASWRILRDNFLRANPMCQGKDCKHVATMVHHKDHNPRNNSQVNLMAVCRSCHELIHGPDRFKPRAQGGK